MKRLALFAALVALSACQQQPDEAPPAQQQNSMGSGVSTEDLKNMKVVNHDVVSLPQADGDNAADYANMPITVPGPGEPGGLPDDRTPISEAPFTPDSAQGAADVLQRYYAFIGERRYDDALKLWEPGIAPKRPDLVRDLDLYAKVGANIGAPGRPDPGAGQVYIEVPVQFYGRLKTGKVVNMLGKATLHRVNTVDGSTAEERRWHIRSIDVKSAP